MYFLRQRNLESSLISVAFLLKVVDNNKEIIDAANLILAYSTKNMSILVVYKGG